MLLSQDRKVDLLIHRLKFVTSVPTPVERMPLTVAAVSARSHIACVAALGMSTALLAACGGAQPGASTAPPGHIRGSFTLTAGPVPSCAGASPCPSPYVQPVAHATITVAHPDGAVVATTTTDAAGAFNVDVPPGSYVVSTPPPAEPGRFIEDVTVTAGQTADVTLQITEP